MYVKWQSLQGHYLPSLGRNFINAMLFGLTEKVSSGLLHSHSSLTQSPPKIWVEFAKVPGWMFLLGRIYDNFSKTEASDLNYILLMTQPTFGSETSFLRLKPFCRGLWWIHPMVWNQNNTCNLWLEKLTRGAITIIPLLVFIYNLEIFLLEPTFLYFGNLASECMMAEICLSFFSGGTEEAKWLWDCFLKKIL